jgi:hypothetical protein
LKKSKTQVYAQIAVICIARQQRKYAVDANLYRLGVTTSNLAASAYMHYCELGEALAFFDEIANGKTGLPMFDDREETR